MSTILEELEAKLPPKMVVPEALKKLYAWIESKKQIKMIRSIFCVLVAFLLFSCSSDEDKLIGKWDVKYVELSNVPEEFEKMLKDKYKMSVKKRKYRGNTLILNPDHSYFLSFGKGQISISYGTWELDKTSDTLRVLFNPADERLPMLNFINILDLSSSKMKVNFGYNMESLDKTLDIFDFNFVKSDEKFYDSDYRSFTNPELNMWRLRATEEQSEEQIKERLVNALDFAITYLNYNIEVETKYTAQEIISPLPIRLASNGIALDENENWAKLFFDEYEVGQTYLLINQGFVDIRNTYTDDEVKKSPLKMNAYFLECLRDAIIADNK